MQRSYYHIVWTTLDRAPTIDALTAHFLNRYLPTVAGRQGAEIVASGLVSTHIHLLVRVSPTTSMPTLVQGFKGGSAAIANRDVRSAKRGKLRWARGHSATSVSEASLDRVRRYVQRQPEHHPDERIEGWPEASGTNRGAGGQP